MKKLIPIIAFSFFLVTAGTSYAEGWRGITPLHSTRKDVRKILGKPFSVSAHKHVEHYRINDYFVQVEYASGGCDSISDNWGNFKVPEWTVQLISVQFGDPGMPLSDFGITNLETLERVPWSSGDIQYYDRAEGVAYTIRKGKVIGTDYAPSSADNSLRCQVENGKGNS